MPNYPAPTTCPKCEHDTIGVLPDGECWRCNEANQPEEEAHRG